MSQIPLVRDDPSSLHIIYEDTSLLVVVKPAYMRTSPIFRYVGKSMQNMLLGYHEPLYFPHRLDRLTSGVYISVKDKALVAKLIQGWEDTRKEYLAIVRLSRAGPLQKVGDVVQVDAPILASHGRTPACAAGFNLLSIIDHEFGSDAATSFRVLALESRAANDDVCPVALLACSLDRGGRTHQIRLHASSVGAPLLGDDSYGGDCQQSTIVRPALHAFRMALRHPDSDEPLTFRAELAEDMVECLSNFGINHHNAISAMPELCVKSVYR